MAADFKQNLETRLKEVQYKLLYYQQNQTIRNAMSRYEFDKFLEAEAGYHVPRKASDLDITNEIINLTDQVRVLEKALEALNGSKL